MSGVTGMSLDLTPQLFLTLLRKVISVVCSIVKISKTCCRIRITGWWCFLFGVIYYSSASCILLLRYQCNIISFFSLCLLYILFCYQLVVLLLSIQSMIIKFFPDSLTLPDSFSCSFCCMLNSEKLHYLMYTDINFFFTSRLIPFSF